MLTKQVCPKCNGNLYISTDYYGRYKQCLQCGWIQNLPDPPKKIVKEVDGSQKNPWSSK